MTTQNEGAFAGWHDDPLGHLRHERLSEPHIASLAAFSERIRAEIGPAFDIPADHIPDFDPNDGGIHAKALLLMEAPGPKAVGTGFISRDNPDLTARNLDKLLRDAGIDRKQTALWNIVPWYVGTEQKIRPVNRHDLQRARPYLNALLPLFPNLRVVVLVGRKAQAGWTASGIGTSTPIVSTYHPSPLVFHTSPEKKRQVRESFAHAAALIQGESSLEDNSGALS